MTYTMVFTGTQAGMTDAQKKLVARVFTRGERLYHGCCVGADKQAHGIYREVNGPDSYIEGFPSTVAGKVAYCATNLNHPPAPPLERNRTMIEAAIRTGNALCVATPKEMQEQLRSGTWATIRYAKKRRVRLVICWPDGTMTQPSAD